MLAPAALGAGVLAASAWLAEPRVGYVAASAFATVAGGIALYRIRRTRAWVPTAVALVALLIATVNAGRAQIRLEQFSREPAAVAARERAIQEARLRVAVSDELAELRAIAYAARRVPRDP